MPPTSVRDRTRSRCASSGTAPRIVRLPRGASTAAVSRGWQGGLDRVRDECSPPSWRELVVYLLDASHGSVNVERRGETTGGVRERRANRLIRSEGFNRRGDRVGIAGRDE